MAHLSHKREVLIIEDNELNRDILAAILEDEYEILLAENGAEGLELLKEHYQHLSVIMLDMYMPVMDGFEFLEQVMQDAVLSSVPVIVTTGSEHIDDESKALHLGASDFVTKPYNVDIVRARVRSIIKLKESVNALSIVEYDSLTGLHTMAAFFHHAENILQNSGSDEYDMIVFDLLEFKLINSLLGPKKGDEVLKYIGEALTNAYPDALLARRGDMFFGLRHMLYRPGRGGARGDIEKILADAPVSRLNLKLGVYQNVDKSVPVSILCDRVMMGVQTVKDNFTEPVGYYDDNVQKKLLENQRLEASFADALANEEFVIWYQPKVDVKTETIVAAEALVRWMPPSGKMISPGAFIPLFEGDGLICQLDEYVFTKVCKFQAERIAQGKKVVPISVNLSRNTVFQPGSVDHYAGITDAFGLDKSLVPLEITESAAADSKMIVKLAKQLIEYGFELHMDDFGTGYSSLSCFTSLPFSVLKLDKSLIDNIGSKKGDAVMGAMTRLAHEMNMHVVAEGVEEKRQVFFLRSIDCDMIQGYFYAPPGDSEVFEQYLDGYMNVRRCL